ncbi:hydrolase [Sneathiella aquimaris]|uniref:hydrolase n=1 Tax=Sneathiella aquimaris TaxID=2599305 RepID=UPI001469AB92|nr:hydrolase [Sneathiella aquimaris]
MSLPSFLSWIDDQQSAMVETVCQWAQINSGSDNLEGLAVMADHLQKAFDRTGGQSELLASDPMPLVTKDGYEDSRAVGQMLKVSIRPEANRRVLLCGHMDTVFDKGSPFQSCTDLGDGKIGGPGTADMKGGLMVILTALQAFERSPDKSQIGWDVLINADEEIGSFGSRQTMAHLANKADLGLVYEPSLADGTLAGARKGSGNFTLVVRGKAAHAGRDHHLGRNAIAALSEAVGKIHMLSGQRQDLTVNVGHISGGGALNVVPDLAICRLNVRIKASEDKDWFIQALEKITAETNGQDGISAQLHGQFTRPPKPMSPSFRHLFDILQQCGEDLNLPINQKPTGGCCDGNNLAAAGLPNIDTLGVRGANIHSDQEYMISESLSERAKLTALLLHKLAVGDVTFPKREEPQ